MRRIILSLAFLAIAAPAAAAPPPISASSPAGGLPALSKDKKSYARPVVVQPKDCSGVQTFVELGAVGTPRATGKSELLLVDDDCGAGKGVAANLEKVNARLVEGGFSSLGTLEARSLPTDITTAYGTLAVERGSGRKVSVAIAGRAADHWSVQMEGEVLEVHGWYESENASGDAYVAVQLAVSAKDTGARGRERWVEFWPVDAQGLEAGTPAEVGVSFVKALVARDAAAVKDLMSAPFWKVGLRPVAGAQKKACKKLDKAKRDKDLAKVARCMAAGASALYAKFSATEAVAEIDMSEFPDELKKHKKKVAKLVKNGAKLVRYHVNQDGFYVFLVLVLDVETNHGTVAAALEYIDVDAEPAGE